LRPAPSDQPSGATTAGETDTPSARAGTVAALVGCAALAVGLTVAVTGPSRGGEPALTSPTATTIIAFTSRPPHLTLADIARYGSAFEIRGEPEQEDESWEVADPERSIVLQRGPAGWYALFTDSSVLLDPPVPGTALPLATAEAAPSATDALDAARAVLTSAGALTGTWDARVGDAAPMPAVCRPLPTHYDCDEIRLATRQVVFTRTIAGRPTTVEWEVLVGPNSRILDAVGRVAIVAATGRPGAP
jgi:hypothetical protein